MDLQKDKIQISFILKDENLLEELKIQLVENNISILFEEKIKVSELKNRYYKFMKFNHQEFNDVLKNVKIQSDSDLLGLEIKYDHILNFINYKKKTLVEI